MLEKSEFKNTGNFLKFYMHNFLHTNKCNIIKKLF